MDINQHIEKLEKAQAQKKNEIELIAALRLEFPDLEITTDRWGKARYMARSANARVNEVLIHRNCGCCADSPVHARPYLKLNNGTYVYSNPCDVMIGEPNSWGEGFREYAGWEAKYVEAGINPQVITAIRNYIANQQEEEEEEEEEG